MAIEQNLAQLSNVLVYSSMAVYTGAFGAFVADLGARGARAGLESARLEARELATVGEKK